MPTPPRPPPLADLDHFGPAIAAGDDEAFARWMAGAEPMLRASLRSFARFVDTEALVQESLLRVWQVAPRFVPDGRPNALLRLAVRMARNLALTERRRAARIDPASAAAFANAAARGAYAQEEAQLLTRWAAPVPAPIPSDPLLRRALEECRAQLPDKPRAALTARVASAGTEADDVLAARLQMRLNTFLQNVVRARKHMAECLRARGVDLDAQLT